MAVADPPRSEILIHMRRLDAPTPAVDVGLAIAQRLRAWAIGLHVVPMASAAFASPEAVALYVHESDGQYQAALQRGDAWQTQLAHAGVEGEWLVAHGDTVEALCHASRWCDLVVLERPRLVRDAPTGWGVVSRTVFGAAAPVVVVPEASTTKIVGANIVIVWNHSRQATLAIRGALPLLLRAERVTVLDGDAVETPFGQRYLPEFDLAAWLARHRIEAEFRDFHGGKARGAKLLDAARTLGADLVVVGVWGHSRITELVLGGTTRHLLEFSDLPLLVAH